MIIYVLEIPKIIKKKKFLVGLGIVLGVSEADL